MIQPMVRKLLHSGFLTEADQVTLRNLPLRTRWMEANEDLIREGDRPENVFIVLSGVAGRYKLLGRGRRQIMALLVPGDFCDLHVALLHAMDHSLATFTRCLVAEATRPVIEDLMGTHPRIARALGWATLSDEGILREWLVNMGQRPADRAMAHLFCELHLRFSMVGLAKPNGYDLPLTQRDLGDTLGLSGVHVNRTLQDLRAQGLIAFRSKWLELPDVPRLQAFCEFNPNYLHLTPRLNGTSRLSG